jgi:hypothetical protein
VVAVGDAMARWLWLLLYVAACSSTSEDDEGTARAELDCAWVQSQNCWKQVLDEVARCIPQPDENGFVTTGVLDATGASCSYDNGTVVYFDDPLMPPELENLRLHVERGGSECFRLERSYGHLSLSLPSGALIVDGQLAPDQTVGMTITCPDGSTLASDDYLGMLRACEPDPSDWPGLVVEQMGPAHIGLDLSGGNGGQIEVFACTYE